MRRIITFLALALLATACGSDDAPSISAEDRLGQLDVEYSCGWGFYLSDVEETTALYLFAEVADPESPADLTESRDWRAELHIGENLFANWCNDVVLEGTPEPILNDIWEISSGTITLTTSAADCGQVEGKLADVAVLTPDGEEISIENRSLTNTGWGCFAG